MSTGLRALSSRLGTVRVRTTLLATVVVAVALTVGAVALLVTLRHALVRTDDDAARARVRDLASLATAGALPHTLTVTDEDDLAVVVGESGAVLAAGPASDRSRAPSIATFVPDGTAPQAQLVENVSDGSDDEDYRVWAMTARTADGPATVYVGSSLEAVGETMATVERLLLAGLPLLLVVLALSTWVLVGQALRPVDDIRAEVAEITDHDLGRRVPVPTTDDEISRLARTMNSMLVRLEAASDRQRAFVADSSHELQSPLTSLRTQLEVGLADPATDWRSTAADLLDECQRMERLVRDLLYLARADGALGSVGPVHLEPVDLDDVVLDEALRVRSTSRIKVATTGVSAAPMLGSRDELTRLTRNLLENAVRHAVSRVSVDLAARNGHIVLSVADDGPGVPPEQRERIFDRFARLDDARDRDAGGTGLGLAIVRDIADRHGGAVRVEDALPGARFVVTLPSDRTDRDAARQA